MMRCANNLVTELVLFLAVLLEQSSTQKTDYGRDPQHCQSCFLIVLCRLELLCELRPWSR